MTDKEPPDQRAHRTGPDGADALLGYRRFDLGAMCGSWAHSDRPQPVSGQTPTPLSGLPSNVTGYRGFPDGHAPASRMRPVGARRHSREGP